MVAAASTSGSKVAAAAANKVAGGTKVTAGTKVATAPTITKAAPTTATGSAPITKPMPRPVPVPVVVAQMKQRVKNPLNPEEVREVDRFVDGFLSVPIQRPFGNESRRVRFAIDEVNPKELLPTLKRLIENGSMEKVAELGVNLYQVEQWEAFNIIKSLIDGPITIRDQPFSGGRLRSALSDSLLAALKLYYRKMIFGRKIPRDQTRCHAQNELVAKILQADWTELFEQPVKCLDSTFSHYFDQPPDPLESGESGETALLLVIDPGESRFMPNELVRFDRPTRIYPVPTTFVWGTFRRKGCPTTHTP